MLEETQPWVAWSDILSCLVCLCKAHRGECDNDEQCGVCLRDIQDVLYYYYYYYYTRLMASFPGQPG